MGWTNSDNSCDVPYAPRSMNKFENCFIFKFDFLVCLLIQSKIGNAAFVGVTVMLIFLPIQRKHNFALFFIHEIFLKFRCDFFSIFGEKDVSIAV